MLSNMSKRKVFPDLCWGQRKKVTSASVPLLDSVYPGHTGVPEQGFPGWSMAGERKDAWSCPLVHLCVDPWLLEGLVSSRDAMS